MTNIPRATTPAERKAILTFYAAARRIFARRFEGDDAYTLSVRWTCRHATQELKLDRPLVKAADALGLSKAELADRLDAFNDVAARCGAEQLDAYVDATLLHDQIKRSDRGTAA